MHLPALIVDLTLILCVASFVALIFRFLKLPLVLGYLIAGIIVGPQINLTPTVNDTVNIRTWGELGVVFLIFLLGLEFSFKKLLSVGRAAVISAFIEVPFMILLGFGVGKLLGWDNLNSFFLGSILSISSTTIIIKTYEELGIKTQSFANIVFGILIIEDLIAIILLAVLSATGASTASAHSISLGQKLFIIPGIILLIIPAGLWLVPIFFKFSRKYLNDEIRILLALALCLLFVFLSAQLDLSPALGAFIMGAFLAESSEGERTERFLKPISSLFGAIFFTSIGMLVDIQEITTHIPLIGLLSLIVIIGKTSAVSFGTMLSGQNKLTSIRTGFSLSQIGEFSFIIATLGVTKNIISPKIYSIAVAVSIITTFTTPFLINASLKIKDLTNSKRKRSTEPRIWQGHLVEFEIHPHFKFIGSTLEDLNIREKFGVSIVELKRGHLKILAPTRTDRLMPYDQIVVLGSDSQLSSLESFLKSERSSLISTENDHFEVFHYTIQESDRFAGKSIRNSGIREDFSCIILGLERNSKKILNPISTFIFENGDKLWIYGDYNTWKSSV